MDAENKRSKFRLGTLFLATLGASILLNLPDLYDGPFATLESMGIPVALSAGFLGSAFNYRALRLVGWIAVAAFALVQLISMVSGEVSTLGGAASPSGQTPYVWPLYSIVPRTVLCVGPATLLALCYWWAGQPSHRQSSTNGGKRLFLVIGSFAAAAAIISLYVYRELSIPYGYITLEYEKLSSTGAWFRLESRSNKTIFLRGNGTDVWPGEAVATCTAAGSRDEDRDPVSIVDGPWSVIRIRPGDQVRLDIPTTRLAGYKDDGFCRLRLSVLGGTFIESNIFTPH